MSCLYPLRLHALWCFAASACFHNSAVWTGADRLRFLYGTGGHSHVRMGHAETADGPIHSIRALWKHADASGAASSSYHPGRERTGRTPRSSGTAENRSRHFSSPCSGYGRSVSVPLPTVPSAALSSFTFPSTMVSSPVMSLTRSSTTSLVSLPISSRRPSPSTSVWS